MLDTETVLVFTIAAVAISYVFALPFYLLVERPFKNFLDLILFPNKNIYVVKEEEEQDSEEEEEEEEYQNLHTQA